MTIRIVVPAGERVIVSLEETDGEFVIDYNSEGDYKLTVHADIADSAGRQGIIYEEDFSSNVAESDDWDKTDEDDEADELNED